jgi:hypothetical protein
MFTFITYNFRIRWQDEHYQFMMNFMPEGVLVFHIDFAENYSFFIQNKVQSLSILAHPSPSLFILQCERKAKPS